MNVEPFHIEPRRYTLPQSQGRIEIDAEDFLTPGKVVIDCVGEDGEIVASYTNAHAWQLGLPAMAPLTSLGRQRGFPAYLCVQLNKPTDQPGEAGE